MSDYNVESAPESLDLDELLGLTDLELEDESSEATEEVVEVEDIDEPHITIPTKKILDILKISAMISAAGENSFEGKVVVFKVEDDEVKLLLSDNKRNIEKATQILNTDNKFKGFIAFSTQFLARLIKLCDTSFTIIERTETKDDKSEVKNYFLKVNGGEVRMDNVKMSEAKFVRDFTDDSIKQFNRETVVSSIKRLYTFASTAIKSGKNLDFSDNMIQATPINSLAKIVTEDKYPSFKLSLTDCRILHTLLLSETGDTFGINKDGKIFTGETFKFKTESFQVSKCAFDAVAERMFNGECAVVDVSHLMKLAELSVGLDTSVGTLKFNYTEEGRVECELLTKRGNSKLIVQGTTNTDLVVMEKPVEIPASNLKGALSVFPQETTLNMRISSDGVALDTANTIKVSVLGKGIGK